MTGRTSTGLVVALVVIAGLAVSAGAVQGVRERQFTPPSAPDASLYLTSGATARRLSLGYDSLAADLYWIRTIQYFGDTKLRLAPVARSSAAAAPDTKDYTLLYPLLDLTTSLDPRFNIAYRFGSIFLAEAYPGGAGRPDLAIALLEKGLRDQPDKWEYMQDIGFIYYWWLHDYKAASEWFDEASQAPGAPWFLRSLAATTLAEGGDRASSRTMWQSIRDSAEIDWLKADAERRLMQLDAMDFMAQVQQRVDRYASAAGHLPASWAEMIEARAIEGIPNDPYRVPYQLGPAGRVTLSPQSPLFPLPDEPKRIGTPGS